ncbi:MAG TPA: O-antigen ligase family protein, partial [Rhodanobacteraceae bacterium]|nr:O-antigen ligase family protein [Rhodanobacteraceae bacterium]
MSRVFAAMASHRDAIVALLPLWCVIVLLPFGRSAELGSLLAIVLVAVGVWRQPRAWLGTPTARLLLALFAAYFLAALLSALDAIRPARSWETCLGLLRFACLGLYAAHVLDRASRLRAMAYVIAAVATWWALDAWLQFLTGWSIGGPAEPERITGIFGAGNPKLGIVLATLAPFVLWAAREWRGRLALVLAFAFLLLPVLVAGSRQGWLAYALVTAIFVWRECGTPRRFVAWMGLALLAMGLAGLAAWQVSPRFDARMQRSLLAFDGSTAALNTALSGRLDIWRTALGVFETHPFNGVGVRDFRYAYPRHARPGDRFVTVDNCGADAGACHPHQWLLEVASETGVIGVLLWL